jgi:hypothetical protein
LPLLPLLKKVASKKEKKWRQNIQICINAIFFKIFKGVFDALTAFFEKAVAKTFFKIIMGVFEALTAFSKKAVAKTFFKIIKDVFDATFLLFLTPLFSKVAKVAKWLSS